ncbi:MAG: hypothetical protein AB8I69_22290, partial [Anaerolineae bacterium]
IALGGLGFSLWPSLAGVLAERMGLEIIGPFLLLTSVAMFLLHEAAARRRLNDASVPTQLVEDGM